MTEPGSFEHAIEVITKVAMERDEWKAMAMEQTSNLKRDRDQWHMEALEQGKRVVELEAENKRLLFPDLNR